MTMRDEYRKANDAIHAPQSLLSALHEAADEDTPVLFEPEKPRVWPKVAAFSGIAAAAAVLALIVFLPRNNRSAAPQAAAKAADAEIVYSTETTMESAMSDEAPAEAPMLSASLYAAGSAASADGGEDDIEDEYDFAAAQGMPEQSYADVFALLVPQVQNADTVAPSAETEERQDADTEGKAVRVAGAEAAWTRESDTLTVSGLPLPLPENCGEVAAVEAVAGRVCVVVQNGGAVDVYVYADGALAGKMSQSGVFTDCRVQETSVFGDDNRLETHTVLLVESSYAPDLGAADEADPMSFCPYVWTGEAYRPLEPTEIDLCGEGDTFAVYVAVEPDPVRVLYAFAELGVEE